MIQLNNIAAYALVNLGSRSFIYAQKYIYCIDLHNASRIRLFKKPFRNAEYATGMISRPIRKYNNIKIRRRVK